MYCSQCGKEVADQAKFCNHCGHPMQQAPAAAAPAQASAAPAQPAAQPQQPAAQANGKMGKLILAAVVALVAFFVVKGVTQQSVSSSNGSSSNTTVSSAQAEKMDAAINACTYGGILKNGYLRFGPIRLRASGYTVTVQQGNNDLLVAPDKSAFFYLQKQLNPMGISYKNSDREAMLKSLRESDPNAQIVDFQKLTVNGYPVIRYVANYEVLPGKTTLAGELIVFPSEKANTTLRVVGVVEPNAGYTKDVLIKLFDTLEISPDFAPTYQETGVMDLTSIVAK